MTQPAAPERHPRSGNRMGLCVLLAASAGCGHSEPFGSQDFGSNAPFDPTPPVQLTLNRGHDRRAAWLPDGTGIIYSTQLEGTRDHDICLAVLPTTGGRQRSLNCNLTPDAAKRTESLEPGAVAPDGRLAFVGASSPIGAIIPELQQLSIATLADPAARTAVLSIPYTISGHSTHGGISQLRWLGPSRLLYLGEAVSVIAPCTGCEPDTIRSGLDAVWLDVGAAGSPQAIPGTQNASGVSPGGSEDEVYYTLNGDSRVYHQSLSTGAVTVVFDFGAAGIVRDVDVMGNRLVAVVGGRVHFVNHPTLGLTQWDSGGIVHLVDLSDGSDLTVTDPNGPGLFRRPQVSPSGTQIVVERYPVTTMEAGVAVDTVVARVADLYLLEQQ